MNRLRTFFLAVWTLILVLSIPLLAVAEAVKIVLEYIKVREKKACGKMKLSAKRNFERKRRQG